MIDVSIIIPCYNSASLIERRVLEFEAVLSQTRWTWEILLCDDGSQDQTAKICEALCQGIPARHFFANTINRGRGKNVSDGIMQSHGRIVGFADADQSTSAHYVIPIIQAIESGFDVAVANRSYKMRLGDLPFIAHRLAAHVLYARLVRYILNLNGHDTETGFKFFNRESAVRLLDKTNSWGWFWDTEIIANAHALNLRVAEIPSLFVRTKGMGSTVRLLRDSWHQATSLASYARQHGIRRLRRDCCDA